MKIIILFTLLLTACGFENDGKNSFNGTETIPTTPPLTTETPTTTTKTTTTTTTTTAPVVTTVPVPTAITKEKELKLYADYVNDENRGTEIGTVTLTNGKYFLTSQGQTLPLNVTVREDGEVLSREVKISINATSNNADKVFDNLACEEFSQTGAYTFVKKVAGVTNQDYLQLEKTVDNHYRLFYTGREKTGVVNNAVKRNNQCVSANATKFYQVLFVIVDFPFDFALSGDKMLSENLTLVSKAK